MISEYVNYWFILWICLAWISEAFMDTIAHHKHSSWIFKLNWSDYMMMWWESKWINRNKFLFNLYDGWHSFKGAMLIFQFLAVWSISYWYFGLIFLILYYLIHEILYVKILIGGK